MIKNKIIFALLFATITNFPLQINLSAKEQNSKESKLIKEKSKLTKEEKKQLIIKALTQDSSIISKALYIPKKISQQLLFLISSVVMGGTTTLAINHKETVSLIKDSIDYIKINKQLESVPFKDFFSKLINDSFIDAHSGNTIKIVSHFTLFSLSYYIALNFLFNYMYKEDNTNEKIKKLATVLEQFNI